MPNMSFYQFEEDLSASKVVNTAMFGLLDTKRHKTFHCNNCGYEW